MAAKVTFTK